MPQPEELLARQPLGAVAADRVATEDLSLLRHMLWTQLSSSQPDLSMRERLLFTNFVMEAVGTKAPLILGPARQWAEHSSDDSRMETQSIGYAGTVYVGMVGVGSVLRSIWLHSALAFRSWVLDSLRHWQEWAAEKPLTPGPQPFLASPVFLAAELRWQWHLMVGQPITAAAVTAACVWAWLGPVDKTITGTLILAAFAGILWLLPFQYSPGVPWKRRFLRFLGLPTFYVAFDAALNVFFNALGQVDWLRAILLSLLLFASLANVVVVLASWRLLPVEISLRQFSSGLRAAADKVDSLLDRKESSSAKDVEPPAPGL